MKLSKKQLISIASLIIISGIISLIIWQGKKSDRPELSKNRKERIERRRERRNRGGRGDRISRNEQRNRRSTLNRGNRQNPIKPRSRNHSFSETDWKDASNYKHRDTIIKQFQRFKKQRKNASESGETNKINLKIGKLIEKNQQSKKFSLREVMVEIQMPNKNKTFMALVDEESGKIVYKRGNRINDPIKIRR